MDLRDKLEKAGYVMFEKEDDNLELSLLKDVILSNDMRLWHMFPAILANALKKDKSIVDSLLNNMKKPTEYNRTLKLLNLSYLVFQNELKKSELFNAFEKYVKQFKLNNNMMNHLDLDKSSELFRLYYRKDSDKVKELLPLITDNRLEYALSEIFSNKQKELVLKKLKGEKFSKTENEYYSRVIRKKLVALANEDMHKIAVSIINKR